MAQRRGSARESSNRYNICLYQHSQTSNRRVKKVIVEERPGEMLRLFLKKDETARAGSNQGRITRHRNNDRRSRRGEISARSTRGRKRVRSRRRAGGRKVSGGNSRQGVIHKVQGYLTNREGRRKRKFVFDMKPGDGLRLFYSRRR